MVDGTGWRSSFNITEHKRLQYRGLVTQPNMQKSGKGDFSFCNKTDFSIG